MDDDFFNRDLDSPGEHRDNLFGWTVFILLLIALALACWLGSYYIFGHPENPTSYAILKTMNRIDPPRRFELTAAPPGEFLTPQKLYDRYISFTKLQLENENAELLRNYISNYQETKKLVPYVIGRFNILDSYELKKNDIFSPGVVTLAQAAEFPQVLVEHVYTAERASLPLLQGMLMTGLDIKLERSLDLSAVIHITRVFDGRLQFTVVPLLYGTYALKQATGGFSLQPPGDVRLDADLPILRTATLQESFKTFGEYRKKKAATMLVEAGARPAAEPVPAPMPAIASTPQPAEIARAEATPAPLGIALPKLTPSATPLPVAVETPKPKATRTPAEVAMKSTPREKSTTTRPMETPSPAPAPTSPDGLPLQPFLVSSTTPEVINNSGKSWQVYPPGRMPRGRLVDMSEAASLASEIAGTERSYLFGAFVVTAAGENRAVLRSSNSSGAGSTRVIVEFPAGQTPPAEGSTFSRDELRPFQIKDLRRGADGQVNIYVREITTQ